MDGILATVGRNLSRGVYIEADGNLVIGQEQVIQQKVTLNICTCLNCLYFYQYYQDGVGSDFNEAESFVGHMTYLDIWDRALTGHEVLEMFTLCTPFQGSLYAWSEFQLKIVGSIKVICIFIRKQNKDFFSILFKFRLLTQLFARNVRKLLC